MIHINLLPTRAVDQASSRRRELGLAGGVLATTLIAIAAAHSFQSTQFNEVSGSVERLEGQVAAIRKQHQDIEKLQRQKKELEEKIRVVSLLTSPQRRTASVHILDDLSSSTPEFLWLTEYAENKSVAQIRGKAIDNQTIASFAHNLSNSQYFRSVEIRETQQEAQTVTPRNRLGKNEVKEALAPSVMMTKFLIEAAVNYGNSPVAATPQGDKETAPGKKSGEKPTPTKSATAASASKVN